MPDGKIYPELEAAAKRGVYLDACSGMSHFSFATVRHGLARGFVPAIISTDMSIMGRFFVQSLPVLMSKFMNLGLTLDQVIEATTLKPARAIREEGRRGTLKPGTPADITVLELIKGDYLFRDGRGGGSMEGNLLLEPRMVFKAGKMYPAFSRYHIPPVYQDP